MKLKNKKTLNIIFSITLVFKCVDSLAASATGTARQHVTENVSIFNVSDLNFGSASPGAPELRLPNENTENPQNASFKIKGEARRTFTITLPMGSIFLKNSLSADQIEVRRFRSSPNGTGRILNSGEQMLYVSAQRQAIPTNVKPGFYSGTFVVDVVY